MNPYLSISYLVSRSPQLPKYGPRLSALNSEHQKVLNELCSAVVVLILGPEGVFVVSGMDGDLSDRIACEVYFVRRGCGQDGCGIS